MDEKLNSISKDCIDYLRRIKSDNDGKTTHCVVFDIDETLIYLDGTIIKPILDVYNFARNNGYNISIITARTGTVNVIRYTIDQLRRLNIKRYDSMFFRPTQHHDPLRFKEMSRKQVTDDGLVIVMSIGDSNWDIGKYGGKGVIVPRKTY